MIPAREREVALVLWRAASAAVASFYLAYFTFTCDLQGFSGDFVPEVTGSKPSR